MNKRKLLEVVLVVQICLCLQHVTYGNRNGAPSSACDNMTPSHGPNPQQTSNPYTVTLNTTSYTYGTIVNVTLSSPVGTLFKGYMIQMRRIEDDTMVSGFYIGDSGQLIACNNVEYSTVTHTENEDKNTSSFLWSAPSEADGQLRIVFYIDVSQCHGDTGFIFDVSQCHDDICRFYIDVSQCHDDTCFILMSHNVMMIQVYIDVSQCHDDTGFIDVSQCHDDTGFYIDVSQCHDDTVFYIDVSQCHDDTGFILMSYNVNVVIQVLY
ncbi:unnamed protein product [Mytilus edulis]|uniref:Reelin domain-containing protein n=1 Tax=Mytilus edulis TaxID=6550 RepID=A0A8S3QD75_MYTED|nr:unnamed protein product [Mytilus edulis]